MTGPTPDTPREAEFRAQYGTFSTEQQETLQAASDAIARLQAQSAALVDKVVDDETFAELTTDAQNMKQAADEAQAAFAQVGVTPTNPA